MAEEKQKESEKQEFEFHKPQERGAWESFSRFIHNPDTGQYLGRTPLSWVQILTFYVIFYIGLAALFGGCMWAFYTTIDLNVPKRQLSDSLIGESPGLSIRPLSSEDLEGNFIYYNAKNESQINMWIKKLNDFMERKQ